jgi:hypothetical protein
VGTRPDTESAREGAGAAPHWKRVSVRGREQLGWGRTRSLTELRQRARPDLSRRWTSPGRTSLRPTAPIRRSS